MADLEAWLMIFGLLDVIVRGVVAGSLDAVVDGLVFGSLWPPDSLVLVLRGVDMVVVIGLSPFGGSSASSDEGESKGDCGFHFLIFIL